VAGKFYLIGLIAGAVLIAIGSTSIFVSGDEFAFIRGMMVIITGIIVIALGIRFKALRQ
jgi:sulfite exporter TauE/SafE